VTRFGSATHGHRIDAALRETMPAFLSQPGLAGAWFGRRTTRDAEERALVSVWQSSEAEAASLRLPEGMVELEDDIDIPERIVLPVAFDIRGSGSATPTILRIYDGRTRPGELEAYVDEARAGSRREAQRPGAPIAVCLAFERPDRFVTVSVWSDWSSLEAATGGDIRRPLASHDAARLSEGEPSHYEIMGGPAESPHSRSARGPPSNAAAWTRPTSRATSREEARPFGAASGPG
jgi:heme-degrading monooxygenase HmoA